MKGVGSENIAARRDWWRLVAATVAFFFGFGIYSGVLANFLNETLHLERLQLGQLEALREVPGLLAAGMVGALAWLPEPRLAALATALTGLGVAALGHAQNFAQAVAYSILASAGLHIWLTVQPALIMVMAPAHRQGYRLGLMNAYQSAAMLAGLAFVVLVGRWLAFSAEFGIAGAAMLAGALFAVRISRDRGGGLQRRLLFERKYALYYLLSLLDGGRRQVIATFNVFILVREFGVRIEWIAFMLLLNTSLMLLAARHAGAWTDRVGERRSLSVYYIGVALVFALYTQVPTGAPILFCLLYAVDNLLFTLAVGITTYARHVASQRDLSSTLAMGLTMNHVTAVTVPLAAGWIWQHLGYQKIYLAGVGVALLALLACRLIPPAVPKIELRA
ncbi:MAG: MFS transporter [Armatimonadetes bacterium]|nr:MFS transporter [Armatimonadota bacterium]